MKSFSENSRNFRVQTSNAMKAHSAKLLHVLLKAIPIEEGFNCSQGCCSFSIPIDSTMGDDADPLSKEL